MHIQIRAGWVAACLPLLIATFAVGTDAWVVAGFLPMMASDLHVATGAAGWSVTVFAVAYAIGAPLLAARTATVSRRRVLALALVTLAAANVATALAVDLPMLLISRAVAGAAASLVTPTAGAVAAATAPSTHRARALALVVTGLTLATAIGVPIGAAVSVFTGWRGAVGGVAALCLLTAVAVLLLAPDVPGSARAPLVARFAPLADFRVRRTLILTTLGMAAAYCGYAFVGPVTGTSGGLLTAVLVAYGCGALGGSLTSGPLTDRVGARYTLAAAYGLMAAALLIVGLQGPLLVTLFGALLWGAASWAQTPPQQHRLLASAPDAATMVIGLNASALYLGIAAGTGLGSVLLPLGVHAVIWCAIGAAIAAALVSSFVVPERAADRGRPAQPTTSH